MLGLRLLIVLIVSLHCFGCVQAKTGPSKKFIELVDHHIQEEKALEMQRIFSNKLSYSEQKMCIDKCKMKFRK